MIRHTMVLCVFVLLPPIADAAKVKVWQQIQPAHFDKAKFQNTLISSDGTIRLSRQVKPLANLEAAHVWSVLKDKLGNLYAATGDDGKIFKVSADGKTSIVYTGSDSQVLCLAQGPDGTIYAGTGPTGRLIRIAPDGVVKVLAENLDSYVWALVYDPASQTVLAGTGPKGRVFQITTEGKATVYYQTKQDHIMCLALGAKGGLYAGTDKGGLVYRIDGKGKGFVLYHAQQSEIKTLLVTDSAVYAGTSSPTRKPVSPGKTPGAGFSDTADDLFTVAFQEKASSPPSMPTVGDNSLYRIAPDGSVRELFRDRVLILSLLPHNGRLLVGSGMQGQLFEIDEKTKEKSEIARLDHGQIHCLLRRRDGAVVLGTGDPGKLYALDDRYTAKGTVLSDVLDAKIISKWGALNWKAEVPSGTALSVAVRSGNVAEPDATWSAWSAEQTDSNESKALAPAARYFQYRVTLRTDKPLETPHFKHFVLRYKTTNQAPEVTSLDVPDLEAVNQDAAKKIKIRWNAVDPNEDELTYQLFFKKEGWKDWVLLEEEFEKREFEWDTTTTPSGVYQFKVTASDRRDNAPEEALTAQRISNPFVVANGAPAVTLKVNAVDGGQASLEAGAADPLARLTEAAFSINGKRWRSIFPTDGIFDSKTEQFRFQTETLRPGTYVLMVRVRNAAGITGTADVLFTIAGKK